MVVQHSPSTSDLSDLEALKSCRSDGDKTLFLLSFLLFCPT